ncbi:unnamed protein product [Dibothriocephalus latus]|uniref:Midasin n=1 Tax=Dibothriocephalus latus TaxID=60516 RepID=A0A3P7PCJ2_DIBLA|nr:unnamed protein product [Dibothriocephalus latus]
MTSQEQIEGTQNDTQQSAAESKPEEANDAQGIEMPDDFTGDLDDKEGALEGEEEKERKEEADSGLDEKMGENQDLQPDEEQLSKEMWGDDEEAESDQEEDQNDRKDAKSSSAGVKDPAGKSNQSKSTAKEEGGADDKSADEDGEDEEQQQQQRPRDEEDESSPEADEKKKKKKQKLDATSEAGQETVAGEEGEENQEENATDGLPNQPPDADAMKKDEELLAQGEADRLKSEEEQENEAEPNGPDDVEFGENEDAQPHPNEFDNLDETNRPEEEIDLKNQPMDVDEPEKDGTEDGDVEIDEADYLIPDMPSQQQDPSAKMDLSAPNQNTADNMPPLEGASVGSAVRGSEDKFSLGAQNPTSPNPQFEESGDQRSAHQRDQEASSTDKPEEEAADAENTDVVQHIEEADSNSTMTAFDAATDAQKEAAGGDGQQPETEPSAKPGLDTESVLPRQLPEEESTIKPPPPSFNDSGLPNQPPEEDSSAAPGADVRTLPKPDMDSQIAHIEYLRTYFNLNETNVLPTQQTQPPGTFLLTVLVDTVLQSCLLRR